MTLPTPQLHSSRDLCSVAPCRPRAWEGVLEPRVKESDGMYERLTAALEGLEAGGRLDLDRRRTASTLAGEYLLLERELRALVHEELLSALEEIRAHEHASLTRLGDLEQLRRARTRIAWDWFREWDARRQHILASVLYTPAARAAAELD